jgi:hypothetical protein
MHILHMIHTRIYHEIANRLPAAGRPGLRCIFSIFKNIFIFFKYERWGGAYSAFFFIFCILVHIKRVCVYFAYQMRVFVHAYYAYQLYLEYRAYCAYCAYCAYYAYGCIINTVHFMHILHIMHVMLLF